MTKFYFSLILLGCSFGVSAQNIVFPDPSFKQALMDTGGQGSPAAKDLSGNFVHVDANYDGEISIAEAQQISELFLSMVSFGYQITDITGISHFSNLTSITAGEQHITFLDLSGMVNLKTAIFNMCPITSVNVSGCTSLEKLDLYGANITTIDLNGLGALKELNLYANELTSLDATPAANLEILYCAGMESMTQLQVAGMSHLKELVFADDQLTSIDLSGLTALEVLNGQSNELTGLDLSPVASLKNLRIGFNHISSIDLNAVPLLEDLEFSANGMTSIDVSMLTNLRNLATYANELGTLDCSGLNLLGNLYCPNSGLTSLNLTGCYALYDLDCSGNQLTTLDMTDCQAQYEFDCHDNNLISLFTKNGSGVSWGFNYGGNPDLQYICADEFELEWIAQPMYVQSNYPDPANVVINSYCSFVPGGAFETVSGSQKFDVDGNGCDLSDPIFPNLKLFIDGEFNDGTLITDNSGNYYIPMQAGTYTITPVFENPGYFVANPESLELTIPSAEGQTIQDFCVEADGEHHDVRISLIPIGPARPGFNSEYLLVYQNVGTEIESGQVSFSVYQHQSVAFLASTPNPDSSDTGFWYFEFTDLMPFESREIHIVMNVNSPLETPAVEVGDELDFSAHISPNSLDLTPPDNGSGLKQIVVGSFDPNDKTCTAGALIGPGMVGEYLNYVIRFENTGTYAAENVVIVDYIDLSKYDIGSLVPITASHSFYTRITGNKVEFIFENIQLPFDDAHNDGFVSFRIKTLPSLVLGDSFENAAAIYFDYNAPVITDAAVTTVSALSIAESAEGGVVVYPNPVSDVLTVALNAGTIGSHEIYDLSGRLVASVIGTNTLDVSGLNAGTYLLKTKSENKVFHTKFLKN